MGSFSIWHWLIVLLVVAIPFVAIIFARGQLTRNAFILRFIAAFVVLIVSGAFAEAGYIAALLPIYALNFFIFRWTAMRLIDVGWSRWWTMLWFPWPVGLILAIILCVKRSSQSDETVA